MIRHLLIFCLLGFVTRLVAVDRLVLTQSVGGPPIVSKSTNNAPAPRIVTGAKFETRRKDVETVVHQLGDKTVWWDVGPDASYATLEIYLGTNRYTLNSWYPRFRTNQTVAVSETRGLVSVSGLAEKTKIEESNSERYRSLVGLFAKVEMALQQSAGSK